MRSLSPSPRGARAVVVLLVGLLVGGWIGGGLVWVLNRNKYRNPDTVADVSLAKADELDLVPADALAFAHVRLADFWHTDAMVEFRKIVEKAGPDAAKLLDEGFIPTPSSLDRATVFVMPKPRQNLGPFGVVGILSFSAPFDAAKVREANLPQAIEQTIAGKKYWIDMQNGLAVYFPSDRVMMLGNTTGLNDYLQKPLAKDGPLSPGIRLAAGGARHLVLSANMTLISQLQANPIREMLPPEASVLMRTESLSVGMIFGGGVKLDVRAVYPDAGIAEDVEKGLRALAETGRKKLKETRAEGEIALRGKGNGKPRPIAELPQAVGGLLGIGGAATLDDWLANPPLVREGRELSVSVTLTSSGVNTTLTAASIGLLVPAVQKIREAAVRNTDSNNLKQMALALHIHQDSYGFLPKAGGMDRNIKGKLSWRVAILPFIEQQNLYQQFKLDEPWDSPNNKRLIPRMPKLYVSPFAPTEPGKTHYKVFVGPDTMFDPRKNISLVNIPDGTANTIMLAEGGDPVIWTKPDDFEFDAKKPLPNLWLPGKPGINVALADGSVRFLPKTISERTLKNAIQINDGLPLGPDF